MNKRNYSLKFSIYVFLLFLYSVPSIKAQPISEPVSINSQLIPFSPSNDFLISPNNSYIVFLADLNTPGVFELFSSPIDGGDPVQLNGNLELGGYIGNDFQISNNGSYVIYRADQNADQIDELFIVPIDGGKPILLTSNFSTSNVFDTFQISPNDTHVIYSSRQNNVNGLFSVDIDGENTVRLNSSNFPLSVNSNSAINFKISSDGLSVVFLDFSNQFFTQSLFSVPTSGNSSPIILNAPSSDSIFSGNFQISPDNKHVVYIFSSTFPNGNHHSEIFSAPIGGGNSIRLNGDLIDGGNVSLSGFQISPDSTRVVYVADQFKDEVFELFSVLISGEGSVKLNEELTDGGDVLSFSLNDFQITPDSAHVIYRADKSIDGISELFSSPINGGDAIKLNGKLEPGDIVNDFVISPNSTQIVYTIPRNIFSVNIDGSNNIQLNDEQRFGPGVLNNFLQSNYQISPDGLHVLFLADQLTVNLVELFISPITGGGSSRVNSSFPFNLFESPASKINSYQVSPDGQHIIYKVDQNIDNISELFSVSFIDDIVNADNETCFPVRGTNDSFTTICL